MMIMQCLILFSQEWSWMYINMRSNLILYVIVKKAEIVLMLFIFQS